MTADGTPAPQAGESVSTAAELDALADGSIVRDGDGDGWQRTGQGWCSAMSSESPMDSGKLVGWYAPLTVLFRPDAPQPAPAADAVERAALLRECDLADAEMRKWVRVPVKYVRAALSAARAGEPDRQGPICCENGPDGYCAGCPTAQRDAAAVDREALAAHGGLTDTEFVITAWHIEDGRVVADEKVASEEYRGDAADLKNRVQAVFELMYRRDPFAPEGCVTKAAVIAALNMPAIDLATGGGAAPPTVTAEQEALNRASAWSDYRSEYWVHGTQSHRDFCAGWDAARGNLDIGGVQR